MFISIVFRHVLVQVINVANFIPLLGILEELVKEVPSRLSIVIGTVVVLKGHLEFLTQGI